MIFDLKMAVLKEGIGRGWALLHLLHGESLSPVIRMSVSPWPCSKCTFINPQSRCEICRNEWPCGGARASSASILLDLDEDDLRGSRLGSFVGDVFMPLKSRAGRGTESETLIWPVPYRGEVEANKSLPRRTDFGQQSVREVLRPCSNKRKERNHDDDHGGSSATKCVATPSPVSHLHPSPGSKTWKIMTYNVWFREDIELYNRMKAIGNLIQLHSPDAICLQEVTPSIYEIFQKTNWWRSYTCTIPDASSFPGSYFCLQLTKLPIKSSIRIPFRNSIMGRELIVTQVETEDKKTIAIATSHLESPCPSPPKWDQMFSKERVAQAREAVSFLDRYDNVIFCGDMNWNDGLDGPFPLPVGWTDAWTEMRPGEDGFTYDNRTNKMIKSRRVVKGRLDRFVCKVKDLGLVEIEMVGRDEIPELRYVKEMRGGAEEMVLPVLPSDHYGLVLTVGLF